MFSTVKILYVYLTPVYNTLFANTHIPRENKAYPSAYNKFNVLS